MKVSGLHVASMRGEFEPKPPRIDPLGEGHVVPLPFPHYSSSSIHEGGG